MMVRVMPDGEGEDEDQTRVTGDRLRQPKRWPVHITNLQPYDLGMQALHLGLGFIQS